MMAAGVSPGLPAIAIANATLPEESVLRGTVATISDIVAEAALDGPTLLIFGEVARADGAYPELEAIIGRARAPRYEEA
jgi:siroheme synthase